MPARVLAIPITLPRQRTLPLGTACLVASSIVSAGREGTIVSNRLIMATLIAEILAGYMTVSLVREVVTRQRQRWENLHWSSKAQEKRTALEELLAILEGRPHPLATLRR